MKHLFRYSRHWLRARGRHGTHSPFVYAFVEQVLRRASHAMPVIAGDTAGLSRKELRLLYFSIIYIKPDMILAGPELLAVLSRLPVDWPVQLLPDTEEHLFLDKRALRIAECNDETRQWAEHFMQQRSAATLLLLRPHANKGAQLVWQQLRKLPGVDMSLDYWHYGLLVKDEAFKARQCFRLR